MGDTNFRDLGGGFSAGAQALGGIMEGKKIAEDRQRAQLNDALNKQKTFNEVAQVAIEGAKLKSQMLQLDPNFDTSQIDLLRHQMTGGVSGLGADQLNGQAQSQGQQQINMLGGQQPVKGLPQIDTTPQFNPLATDLGDYQPLTKRQELELEAKKSRGSSVEDQLRMNRIRDTQSNLNRSKTAINQAINQAGAQEFQSANTWGTPMTYEKLRGTKNAHIADMMQAYKAQAYAAFEDPDPEIQGAAKRANPEMWKQYLEEQKQQSSPANQIKEYQSTPDMNQPSQEEPPQSKNFQPILDIAHRYAAGEKVAGMPDFFSEQALKDKLNKLVASGALGPADADKIIKEAVQTHNKSVDLIKRENDLNMYNQEQANKRDALRGKTRAQMNARTAQNGR
jgi:hypothetical protein